MSIRKQQFIFVALFLITLAAWGCAVEVGNESVPEGITDQEIGVTELAIKNGSKVPAYSGVLRIGEQLDEFNFRWFCSGVLVSNTIALTAKHCVTNFDPSYPKTLRTKMEGSLVLGVRSMSLSKNYDIAMLLLDAPYPMPNRSTGKIETTGYSRPADLRTVAQMHGSVMKCAGIGGNRVVTSDIFSVCGYNDDPNNKSDWFAVSEIGGVNGGQIVHGDSGAPCLYIDGSTKYMDRLPLSGINSGIGPTVTTHTHNTCPPKHRLAQIEPWATAFFFWN